MKEFIKINLASPQKILSWTERSLPNGELVGEITKP
jgi:DNA-directed RNA polymerase subunit beta'